MKQHTHSFIHDFSTSEVIEVLRDGAWKTDEQSATSKETNNNDIADVQYDWLHSGENTAGINAFFDINWSGVKKIIDIGGGKHDINKQYMEKKHGIELKVWDPFNRSNSHNDLVLAEIKENKPDAATSMSVLNVIPESLARIAHIVTVWDALKVGGKGYFKIWQGEESVKGIYIPTLDGDAFQANAPRERFFWEIALVFGAENIKLDEKVPNLIRVIKRSNGIDLNKKFDAVLDRSRKHAEEVINHEEKGLRKVADSVVADYLNASCNESSYFNVLNKAWIYENRDADEEIREIFDQNWGLVVS